jgi:hypothetical protein
MLHSPALDGLLYLYDAEGVVVDANDADLLSMASRTRDIESHRRAVKDRPGLYWLIACLPGFDAILLRVWITRQTQPTERWLVMYGVDGAAIIDEAQLEVVISLSGSIPQIVTKEARRLIGFHLSVRLLERPVVHTNQTRQVDHQLRRLLGSSIDLCYFVQEVSDRFLGTHEVVGVVIDFCAENGVCRHARAILQLLLPDDQQDRLDDLLDILDREVRGWP